MAKYLLRRLIEAVPVLIGISIISYLIVRLAPGDPAALLADFTQLTPAQQQEFRRQLGLEDPIPVQYVKMMAALFTGTLVSFRTGQSTIGLVLEAAPITLLLVIAAVAAAVLTGVLLGVVSALKPYSALDNVVTVLALFGLSVPQFWLGLMLIFLFAENLGWLPAAGIRPTGAVAYDPSEMLPYLVLPTLVMATGMVAALTRYTRSAMLETLGQDFVRTARGKGLAERRVLLVHALRNSLITVVTLVGVLIPILLSGSVVVETVFAVPGLGRLAVSSALTRDYPVVITANLLAAAAVLLSNLLTDVAYTVVDPRIRVGGE
jgi:peptide/nickel transport system permease protein